MTVVWSPLMIGGKESMSSLESRITGYESSSSMRWAYSIPLGCSPRICSMLISSVIARGTKECDAGTVTTLNGAARADRS